ncbi:MAG: hypothetical protein QOE79_2002 [Sphingomonadales bacterium]|jgi:hypothetical protein|nr:hypothetical protein [Sphingomonadales bacterium]
MAGGQVRVAPLLLLLSGCAASQARQAPEVRLRAPAPAVRYNPLGLESVIGRTAGFVEAEFGRPSLDVREGAAHKLQYSGAACVLDLYFYPPKGGGEPIVTWVDARRLDGTDFDRASCVAALQKKAE